MSTSHIIGGPFGPAPGPDAVTGKDSGEGAAGVIGINVDPGGIGVKGFGGNNAVGFLGGNDPQLHQHAGVYGESDQHGVLGHATTDTGTGVFGNSPGGGFGVRGESAGGTAVQGQSVGNNALGFLGGKDRVFGQHAGVYGESDQQGVFGHAITDTGTGVYGHSSGGFGVRGEATSGNGVAGLSEIGIGVLGRSTRNAGIDSTTSIGVKGEGTIGVSGSGRTGIFAFGQSVGVEIFSSGGEFIVGTAQHPGSSAIDNVFRVDSNGRGFFNGGTQQGGADIAEFVTSCDSLHPGDVVEIDPYYPGQFRIAATANSSTVAGVISTDPGVTLGAKNAAGCAGKVEPQLALAGRVPVKVTTENGAIRPGDLLVASSTPGHAMRAPASPMPGTTIGKALSRLDKGTGIVDLLVMLR
jgi:hypothetical protein